MKATYPMSWLLNIYSFGHASSWYIFPLQFIFCVSHFCSICARKAFLPHSARVSRLLYICLTQSIGLTQLPKRWKNYLQISLSMPCLTQCGWGTTLLKKVWWSSLGWPFMLSRAERRATCTTAGFALLRELMMFCSWDAGQSLVICSRCCLETRNLKLTFQESQETWLFLLEELKPLTSPATLFFCFFFKLFFTILISKF